MGELLKLGKPKTWTANSDLEQCLKKDLPLPCCRHCAGSPGNSLGFQGITRKKQAWTEQEKTSSASVAPTVQVPHRSHHFVLSIHKLLWQGGSRWPSSAVQDVHTNRITIGAREPSNRGQQRRSAYHHARGTNPNHTRIAPPSSGPTSKLLQAVRQQDWHILPPTSRTLPFTLHCSLKHNPPHQRRTSSSSLDWVHLTSRHGHARARAVMGKRCRQSQTTDILSETEAS